MRQSKLIRSLSIGIAGLWILMGCTKEKREAVLNGSVAPSGPATLSSIQTDVFRLSCATSGCHDNRANPASNLDLSSAHQSYAQLINRNSSEASLLKLVVPGNADASYLINKLNGTHVTVGGNGVQMPQYGAPISQTDLNRIIDWIAAGAQQN